MPVSISGHRYVIVLLVWFFFHTHTKKYKKCFGKKVDYLLTILECFVSKHLQCNQNEGLDSITGRDTFSFAR